MTSPATVAPVAPLLVDAQEAARLCGVSRSCWFAWQASGQIPLPVLRKGAVVRWSVREIADWLSAGAPPLSQWQIIRGRQ